MRTPTFSANAQRAYSSVQRRKACLRLLPNAAVDSYICIKQTLSEVSLFHILFLESCHSCPAHCAILYSRFSSHLAWALRHWFCSLTLLEPSSCRGSCCLEHCGVGLGDLYFCHTILEHCGSNMRSRSSLQLPGFLAIPKQEFSD